MTATHGNLTRNIYKILTIYYFPAHIYLFKLKNGKLEKDEKYVQG